MYCRLGLLVIISCSKHNRGCGTLTNTGHWTKSCIFLICLLFVPKVISTLTSLTIYQEYVTFSATLKVKTDAPNRTIWLGWPMFIYIYVYVCVFYWHPNAQATCREGLLLIAEQSKDVVMTLYEAVNTLGVTLNLICKWFICRKDGDPSDRSFFFLIMCSCGWIRGRTPRLLRH